MVKGALGVLGAAALLAIGCAQAFALDPVSSVPVPTVSVLSLPVPLPTVSVPTVTSPTATVSVPTVTSPTATVSVSTVTSPTATVTGATASSPSTGVSAPSASLPGSSTSSGSSDSSSGTGGSASGSSDQQSSQAGGGGTRSARPGSGTVRRFEARPPKFRSRGKHRRGTTLVVWLSSDSTLVFSIVQIAPTCRGVGGFTRAGEQGRNRFSFSGRIDGRALSAGTYRIRVAAVQGQEVTSVSRETVVVVAPGDSVRDAHAQKSSCGPGEEAAEDRAEIAAFVDRGPPGTGGPPVSPWAHGGASGSNGAVVAPEGVAPPANFLLQPRAPKLAITSDVDAGWSPLALSTLGAMFIVLFVIGGRELAERYRGRDARWR
jgi:hypothetical protein